MDMPRSLTILREACAENDVAFDVVDTFSGFVARISKGNGSHLVGAAGIGIYPVNRAAPFGIARDKAFTHYVLSRAGINVPEGDHFFVSAPKEGWRRPKGKEPADALAFARRISDGYATPLVAKPNSGKGAKLVSFIRSESALSRALDAISAIDDIAVVQRFIEAPEFRLFLVDGEIAFAYEKARATVAGDGNSSVRALVQTQPARDPSFSPLESDFLKSQLEARGLSMASVLPAGEVLATDFIANISASGRFDGFVAPQPALRSWAGDVAKAVSLRVTGLDVFSCSKLRDPADIIVTDVNGAPNLGTLYDLGHKRLVLDVWKQILQKTFDDSWPEGF